MAKAKKKDDQVQELKPMDFAKAVRLYRNDIKPGKSNSAAELKDVGDAYKLIKKDCHIQPAAAKQSFAIVEMEESRRDDYLRGLVGMVNELVGKPILVFNNPDMVDVAEGKADKPHPRTRPNLVAVQPAPTVSDGVDADLVAAAEDVTGKEEPAAGTSAAAIAAMRADHAKDKAEEDFNGPPPRKPPAED